jgi:hypothetical protein
MSGIGGKVLQEMLRVVENRHPHRPKARKEVRATRQKQGNRRLWEINKPAHLSQLVTNPHISIEYCLLFDFRPQTWTTLSDRCQPGHQRSLG